MKQVVVMRRIQSRFRDIELRIGMDVTDPRSENPLVGFYSGYSDERNATIGTVQKVDGRSLTLERKAVNILDFQELWVFTL